MLQVWYNLEERPHFMELKSRLRKELRRQEAISPTFNVRVSQKPLCTGLCETLSFQGKSSEFNDLMRKTSCHDRSKPSEEAFALGRRLIIFMEEVENLEELGRAHSGLVG